MSARPIIVVAGPTASGKSALALALAEHLDGDVINADSMQVYEGLRILTARPSAQDEARVPHRLYGHVDPAERYSAGRWREAALACIHEAHAAGRRAIVTGGTGFYIEALTNGLSPIPDLPPAALAEAEAEAERLGLPAFAAALAEHDPEAAA
ncbi:MAG: tRNA (adenosine(37)-N6)-dimethylallyltransferase MiaA, partial [Alphaproteobacteria bacterium]|nr:tRNA (adenosine(37)-N6)-dimethylallyltransferase MiaA [Alphaproteobacteria bacterium]